MSESRSAAAFAAPDPRCKATANHNRTPATSLALAYQAIGAKRSIRATATEAVAAIDAAWQHSPPSGGVKHGRIPG